MTENRDRGSRPPDEPVDRRSRIEKILPELIRKALEAGLGTLSKTDDVVRAMGGVPKEIASYLFEQIDETKNGMLRIVAKEFRDFLEHTELADELRKVLTSLSFEIKTEVRFIPSDAAVVRPDVKSSVKAKRRKDPEGGDEGPDAP